MTETVESTYRMIQVNVENVMKCVAFDWTADGQPVVHLKGDNGAGKTSILAAIQMALGGGKLVPDEPQRKGARSWRSEVVLQTEAGDETLTVVRAGRGNGTGTLTITTQEGTKIMSPQALLDTLVSSIALDPLQFLAAKPKDQQETLMQASGIEFDAAGHAEHRKRLYDERTVINRDVARVKVEAEGFGELDPAHEAAGWEVISVADVTVEMTKAAEHNTKVQGAEYEFSAAKEQVRQMGEALEALELEVATKIKALSEANVALTRQATLFSHMEKIDTAEFSEKIQKAQAHNEAITYAKACIAKWGELSDLQKHSEAKTKGMQELDAAKTLALSKAVMPVDGLEFGADGLLFNNIPLAQASTGERLTIAIAVAIAMHPRLRVLFIDEGSVLDPVHMEMVATIAQENDLLVWINSVQTQRPGLLIEDGLCRGATKEA